MKTQIRKNGDTIVVSMDGRVDFETYIPLREDLLNLLEPSETSDPSTQVIFNLEKLEFVGSSGISSFVQTLKEFNASLRTKPRYCNVKNEFRRIIKAFDEGALFEFYESEDRARKSFDQ